MTRLAERHPYLVMWLVVFLFVIVLILTGGDYA